MILKNFLIHHKNLVAYPHIDDELVLFTDGSAPASGKGGYGMICLKKNKGEEELTLLYEESGSVDVATSQRMEVLGFLRALEFLSKQNYNYATIKTDSEYVANTINKSWILGWSKKNFEGRANGDLWAKIWQLYKSRMRFINVNWVPSHVEGEAYNNRVDELAGKARVERMAVNEKDLKESGILIDLPLI